MAYLYESFVKPFESAAAGLLHAAVDLFHGEATTLRHSDQEARLPHDLYAHDDVQTEWWYYTGHCETTAGRYCSSLRAPPESSLPSRTLRERKAYA